MALSISFPNGQVQTPRQDIIGDQVQIIGTEPVNVTSNSVGSTWAVGRS
jgi:hypothetical protein